MPTDTHRILDAIEFAAQAHRGQNRKGTSIPYLVHPMGAVEILVRLGCSEPLIVAGALHDVVEDTDISLETIEERFGKDVADLVYTVTEPNRDDSWEDRKQHTIDYLKSAPKESVFLKFADYLDNLRAMQEDKRHLGDGLWAKFERGKDKHGWYAAELLKVFEQQFHDSDDKVLLSYLQEARRINDFMFDEVNN